ncbi:flagellar hook-basal body complex protein [Sphingomonas sp. T9W2]|uniref:flagellar hook protein FlgE n=1 Tax=Sphingomonas sp. T9W2 TaxID=3143183 RepID=UPI0031F5C43E
MFGAIYIGLSGLNAYSKGLQQVSNNVSNLNTTGFKGSTVSFHNLYATPDRGGMSLTGQGGSAGYGVEVDDGTLNFKQGELRSTDRDLDLSVDGSGFLVLLDGDRTLYARTGSFEVDPAGFIVMSGTSYRLATLDATGRAVSLSVDARRTSAPKATTAVTFADNLSSTATSYAVSDIRVFDASGAAHVWKADFVNGSDGWTVTVTDDKGVTVGTQTLKFNAGIVDPATAKLDFADAASGLTVQFDFSSGVTSFSGGEVSTLRAAKVDGYAAGTITGIAADSAGKLQLTYSNGQKVDGGAIALADFRDPTRLEQRDGLFVEREPGQSMLLASDDPRVGQVRSKRLEASNVDLSQQFGDLILIQRGFQASSQIVSVSNDMIQQLFGIRGQG